MKIIIIYIVIAIIVFCMGFYSGFVLLNNYLSKEMKEIKEFNNKHFELYLMTIQWFQNYLADRRVGEYLNSKGYKRIAIYGVSYIGDTLIKELEKSDIQIGYLIDNNKSHLSDKYHTYKSTDTLEDVDIVIVTPITYYEQIKEELKERVNCPIISYRQIVNDMQQE